MINDKLRESIFGSTVSNSGVCLLDAEIAETGERGQKTGFITTLNLDCSRFRRLGKRACPFISCLVLSRLVVCWCWFGKSFLFLSLAFPRGFGWIRSGLEEHMVCVSDVRLSCSLVLRLVGCVVSVVRRSRPYSRFRCGIVIAWSLLDCK
jgi:hypothetical protein